MIAELVIPVVSDFTTADANPISYAGWTTKLLSTDSNIKTLTNQVAGAGSNNGGYYSAATYGPNVVASIMVPTLPVAGQTAQVFARVSNPGTVNVTGYRIRLLIGSPTCTVNIQRHDASATVITLKTVTGVTFTAGDTIAILCYGSTIEAWQYVASTLTWTRITTVEDSTYSAAGYTGVRVTDSTGRLDNFAVATLATTTVPTVSLQIAPGSRAGDLNPSWSEISAWSSDTGGLLRGFTFSRGQQSQLDHAETGTAAFVINNSSRFLDPSYTLGPFYPNLKPNIQIRAQAVYMGVTYSLFRGHVERFVTEYDGPNYGQTTLECVDRFESLGQAAISGTFNEQTTGARILAVLAAAGWPTTVTPSGWTLGTGALGTTATLGATIPTNALDTGRATVAASTFAIADAKKAVEHINEVVDSEPGRFFFDGAGRAVFLDRSHVVPTPDPSLVTFTDDVADEAADIVAYHGYVPNYDVARIKNDVQLTASDASVVTLQDVESIDAHWRRTLSRTTLLRSWDSDIYQQAGWYLYSLKDALQRIDEITVLVSSQSAFRAILALEIGDHVTVLRTPPGATAETFSQDSAIEKVTYGAAPGPVWKVTFGLSQLPPTVDGWALGTDALDTSTTLVYA